MSVSGILAYSGAEQRSERKGTKAAIIGAGQVGMAIAYAMLIENTVNHLVLVDAVPEKAEGEVMDLLHGLSFASPMTLEAGGLEACGDAQLIIITAGAKRKPGETRLDLMHRNAEIFNSLIPPLVQGSPDAVLVIVSNPVDVMTHLAWKISGLPSGRVLGTGTLLDTSRFRALLSEKLNMDTRNVHAYIIGEHGDSEVAVWSKVNISGVPLQSLVDHNSLGQSWEEMAIRVRDAAKEVIRRKGATCYAIGLGTTRLAKAILANQRSVMTVSCHHDEVMGVQNVTLSLPVVVGADGICSVISLELSEEEEQSLLHSAQTLRAALATLGY